MKLIERYIHEVGRHLPAKNKSNILVELRSTLESKLDSKPTEADVVALLKELGTPREVASAYYPEGQYLIGPTLYPLFRMVIGIALAAVLGAQFLGLFIGLFFNQEALDPVQFMLSLLNSIPVTLGMLMIVFIILQRFDVRPELLDSEWDPQKLPPIDRDEEPIKRGVRIFNIITTIAVLILLLIFQERVGLVYSFGWQTLTNPVIGQYILLITLSLLFGVGLDIYLLRQGRWDTSSRLVKISANVFNIVVLILLVQSHSAWLAEMGATGFFEALARLPGSLVDDGQIVVMQAFRFGFSVALVAALVETAMMMVRFAVRLTMGSIEREPVVIHLKKGL